MRSILVAVSMLALAGCNFSVNAQDDEGRGGGPRVERAFEVGAFESVSLAGSHDVVVAVGPAVSVRAEGPAETLDRLEIEVRGDSLRIGTKQGNWMGSGRSGKATVYVTAPRLSGASIGGSGDMRIDRVESDGFRASVSGSGDMDIDRMQVREARFTIAGSGGIEAAGSAGSISVSITGSGDVDIAGLQSRQADISVVGSGDVSANVADSAKISIVGSGDVEVRGGARCDVSRMGSGRAKCG